MSEKNNDYVINIPENLDKQNDGNGPILPLRSRDSSVKAATQLNNSPPLSLLSFGLMVLGSVVAAWDDHRNVAAAAVQDAVDLSTAASTLNAGYAWMGLNVICSASYALGMRKVIKKLNFKDWDSMFYNNLLSVPVLVVCSVLAEDCAWCMRVTSSTTYSMVGALNKLPLAISGLVFFSAPVTVGSVSAIFIGFISGILYSWAKMRQ